MTKLPKTVKFCTHGESWVYHEGEKRTECVKRQPNIFKSWLSTLGANEALWSVYEPSLIKSDTLLYRLYIAQAGFRFPMDPRITLNFYLTASPSWGLGLWVCTMPGWYMIHRHLTIWFMWCWVACLMVHSFLRKGGKKMSALSNRTVAVNTSN